MTEQSSPLQAPARSYEGQLRQIADGREMSLAAYAADEIAWLRSELDKEQKRLDWALNNTAYYGIGVLTYVDGSGEVQNSIVPPGKVRETMDMLMGNGNG